MKLSFGGANAKLKALEKLIRAKLSTFSVLSGFSCPYAKDCKSFAIEGSDGRITIQDGPDTQWRCFSASQEALFPSVYKSRKSNLDLISEAAKSADDAAKLIVAQIPKKSSVIRIHVGGDFKVQAYFDAWLLAARMAPQKTFYAYTKSIPFWVKRLGEIPSNFVLTASYGGHKDSLIEEYNLRYVKVVGSIEEAENLGLPIDHDDSHAFYNSGNFALLIHGTQPKGSEWGKKFAKLGGKLGISSYPTKKGKKK